MRQCLERQVMMMKIDPIQQTQSKMIPESWIDAVDRCSSICNKQRFDADIR